MNKEPYDYTRAGFSPFLTRTPSSRVSVPMSGNVQRIPRKLAFDRQLINGNLGDTLKVGKVGINGAAGYIFTENDDGEEVTRMGNLDD